MNIPESILNILFLVLSARESPVAILVGFLAVVMTSWKTVLYWLIDQVRPLVRSGRRRSRLTDGFRVSMPQQSGWSYT